MDADEGETVTLLTGVGAGGGGGGAGGGFGPALPPPHDATARPAANPKGSQVEFRIFTPAQTNSEVGIDIGLARITYPKRSIAPVRLPHLPDLGPLGPLAKRFRPSRDLEPIGEWRLRRGRARPESW